MTDRMEPTNRLRWVRQKRVLRNDSDEWEETVTVLQQLWVLPVENQQPMEEPLCEEWRDVPMDDQG